MSACPKCSSQVSSVTKSYSAEDGATKRRRCCSMCGFRFNTVEVGVDRLERLRDEAEAIGSLRRILLGNR